MSDASVAGDGLVNAFDAKEAAAQASFTLHGSGVSGGIAIGHAHLISSAQLEVAHYEIPATDIASELQRFDLAVRQVGQELQTLKASVPASAPAEMVAFLDLHQMILEDQQLTGAARTLIQTRRCNAEWALVQQMDTLVAQFDAIEDVYLRERRQDIMQVAERVLKAMLTGRNSPSVPTHEKDVIVVAHDLSPADMILFKKHQFAGFVTDLGGQNSHTAIVARSLDIPAVVGARNASHLVKQDDWVIIDGDAGVMIVDPSPIILAEYGFKQRQAQVERERLSRLRHTPALTLDGQKIELLANIEMPEDSPAALAVGAVGVGLFRSEFLFMGREGQLPDEEEQFQAYRRAVEGMKGLPVTIRTVDIGADKPLDRQAKDEAHLNPALGLRAIRWSLADPAMFLTQLRAILRAAAHGQVHLLIPMLAHGREIRQTLALLDHARVQLDNRGQSYGPLKIGAMIEVHAAALSVKMFLRYFDFLSIGTNDLIQYTLAIDRADELVAHLYDTLHPAVLRLVADTISESVAQGKGVSVCGEMAGDPTLTRLLLGLGLHSFSMHPTQILAVKQEILRADTQRLKAWAQSVLEADEPATLINT